jgi:hypothetical protein
MGERNQEPVTTEVLDDIFEPGLGELSELDLHELTSVSSTRQCLAEKRRRAEQRLEEKRLRDELGDYDLELDDF